MTDAPITEAHETAARDALYPLDARTFTATGIVHQRLLKDVAQSLANLEAATEARVRAELAADDDKTLDGLLWETKGDAVTCGEWEMRTLNEGTAEGIRVAHNADVKHACKLIRAELAEDVAKARAFERLLAKLDGEESERHDNDVALQGIGYAWKKARSYLAEERDKAGLP